VFYYEAGRKPREPYARAKMGQRPLQKG
jgi:hypothetical protein